MSYSLPVSVLSIDRHPGKAPIVLAETAPGDASNWVAEHNSALHAVVAEHGSVIVRAWACATRWRSVPSSASCPPG